MLTSVRELDCIFLSYDEPCADDNYADLLFKCPKAKRIHGIRGFAAAHKAAARASTTEHFITVDADTVVGMQFFDEQIDLTTHEQHCFCVRNAMTGLSSGNGSIKIWSKTAILKSRTHEEADTPADSLDFWQSFTCTYYYGKRYGITYPDSSPKHAFRAAFRETFKAALMAVDKDFYDDVYYRRSNDIEIWASVGLDSKNGIYSMFGARMAIYILVEKPFDFPPSTISNYDAMQQFVEDVFSKYETFDDMVAEMQSEKYILAAEKIKIKIGNIPANVCTFFKALRTMNVPTIKTFIDQHVWGDRYSYEYNVENFSVFGLSPHDCEKIYNSLN